MADTLVRNSSPTVNIANLVTVMIDGYSATQKVEHILHPRMDSSGFNVTYKPVRLRSGRLQLLFPTAAAAYTAIGYLVTAYTFTLTADVSSASMTFVVAPGELNPQPQEGVAEWVVELQFQEV